MCADPGIGFGKTAAHNLALLSRLSELVGRVEVPVLVGPSRKSFIAKVLGATTSPPVTTAPSRPPCGPSTTARAIVRVHDVAATVDALRLLAVMYALDAEAVA